MNAPSQPMINVSQGNFNQNMLLFGMIYYYKAFRTLWLFKRI
ncbi:hypothetical protein HPNQ4099_0585 [Helicobacter pylori NQ4099]|uniref:Uncharacterized protein n=1 Tax=Helicobacter pylori NQ4099 TaxID=992026 RepID=J0IXQ4_HELPX|nr:hypothetical protein HPNQ4099_0585 [Helicobacter pylori NQ4099]EJC53936.1 hypothetical protein HPHPP41_0543 [Helicobacter pylori Hp P-41]